MHELQQLFGKDLKRNRITLDFDHIAFDVNGKRRLGDFYPNIIWDENWDNERIELEKQIGDHSLQVQQEL